MFPCTFDQKLSQNDMRQTIQMKGIQAIYMKKLTIMDKTITGMANRDGRGGVTLGLSTSIFNHQWDFVLANPDDAKQQIVEENNKWFYNISNEKIDSNVPEDSYRDLFQFLPVIPLTCRQNTLEWFLLHILSCTSSTSDTLLAELKKMILEQRTSTLIDHDTADALVPVLNVVYGVGWDRDTYFNNPSASEVVVAHSIPEDEVNETDEICANVLILLSGEGNGEVEDELKHQISCNILSDEILKRYFEKIGHKTVKDRIRKIW